MASIETGNEIIDSLASVLSRIDPRHGLDNEKMRSRIEAALAGHAIGTLINQTLIVSTRLAITRVPGEGLNKVTALVRSKPFDVKGDLAVIGFAEVNSIGLCDLTLNFAPGSDIVGFSQLPEDVSQQEIHVPIGHIVMCHAIPLTNL